MSPEIDLRHLSERMKDLPFPKHTDAHAKVPEAPVSLQRILVGYDASQGAQDALEWANMIAGAQKDTSVTIAMVLPETREIWGGPLTGISATAQDRINELLRQEEQLGGEQLEKAAGNVEKAGHRPRTLLEHGDAGEHLCRLAKQQQSDLVVMGSHSKRGLEKMLLGSVSDTVKDRAGTSVLITRGPPEVRRILLAVDGSPHSRRAAQALESFAYKTKADVHIVHVLPLPFAPQTHASQTLVQELMTEVHGSLEKRHHRDDGNIHYDVLFGRPVDRILDHARDIRAGLIVMGARGTTRRRGLLLGSVSNRVAHQAKTSVLIIRGRREAEGQEEGS